jgi:Uncharacterised nucleotidyltransferase
VRPSGPNPAVEWELATGLVATREHRTRHAAELARLARASHEERLLRLLADQRVLALAGSRLLEIAPDAVSSAFVQSVDGTIAAARASAVLQEHVALGAVRLLAEEGIPALPLKGPLLGRRVYGDPGLRAQSSDVDVLVRRADLEKAMPALAQLGYSCPDHIAWEDGLPLLHYTLVPAQASYPPLELHWRTHWQGQAFADELVEQSTEDPVAGRELPAELELATALLFYARDSLSGLRLLADVACCWDARGEALHPGALDGIAERHPELARPLLAAAAVAERVAGLPAGRLLTGPPPLNRRGRLACRLAGRAYEGETADAGLERTVFIEWLLTPRAGQAAFLRRNMFQPAAVFAEARRLDSSNGLRARLLRAGHGSARTVRWTLRFARTALGSLRANRAGEGWA